MTKSQFALNIKAIREQSGLTQQQFAEELGVQRQAIYTWERGDIEKPRQKAVIRRICERFDVTEQDLFGFIDGFYPKLHNMQSRIPFPSAIKPAPAKTAPVPLYGRVHAGKPCDPITYDDEKIEIPAHLLDLDPETYALISEGDCMNNIYPEGCTIAVAPNLPPSNGSVAVVSINGCDAVMRRLYRTAHTLILAPDSTNPEHEDIVITDNSDHTVEFLGHVIWFQARRVMD